MENRLTRCRRSMRDEGYKSLSFKISTTCLIMIDEGSVFGVSVTFHSFMLFFLVSVLYINSGLSRFFMHGKRTMSSGAGVVLGKDYSPASAAAAAGVAFFMLLLLVLEGILY